MWWQNMIRFQKSVKVSCLTLELYNVAYWCFVWSFCRGAVQATTMSEFGSGSGNFLLDEVECTGYEDALKDCNHLPWRSHDCLSFETAGVNCKVGKGRVVLNNVFSSEFVFILLQSNIFDIAHALTVVQTEHLYHALTLVQIWHCPCFQQYPNYIAHILNLV